MGSRKDREGRLDEAKKWGGVTCRGNPREERERVVERRKATFSH